jgi:hypothetical protein
MAATASASSALVAGAGMIPAARTISASCADFPIELELLCFMMNPFDPDWRTDS